MRDFYTDFGIDIFKDAVSLPGVAMRYVLKTSDCQKLFTLSLEAYHMLKSSLTGGPSIVFTRSHEAGVSKIRSHQYTNPKLCRRVIGYDANAIYPKHFTWLKCQQGLDQ